MQPKFDLHQELTIKLPQLTKSFELKVIQRALITLKDFDTDYDKSKIVYTLEVRSPGSPDVGGKWEMEENELIDYLNTDEDVE